MELAYLETDLLSDREEEMIMNLQDTAPIFDNFKSIAISDQIELDYLICFSDSDFLQIPRSSITAKNVFVVELPGDNSFFAELKLEHLIELENYLHKTYTDKRWMLTIDTGKESYDGLNDVFISSMRTNTRMRYDFQIDSISRFEDYDSSNGILVSTPTGSTAMALNLGGSYIDPHAEVFQFQSIASRNYMARHQIIPNTKTLTLEILDTVYPILVQVDNFRFTTDSDHITITKSSNSLDLLRFDLGEQNETIDHKLQNKLSFEDTSDLTSSAKFVLHVLQSQDRAMTITEITEITHIQNDKTLRSALKLLMSKGFVRRKENLEDLREHLYYFVDPSLSNFYQS